MKLPEFDVSTPSERDAARAQLRLCATSSIEAIAQACADELRERGRALGIEGDAAHHHDALTSIEQLAGSARTVESIRAARPANDNAGE